MTILRDRYTIIGPVGEGGMGTVRLAEDLRLPGRQCAIKCLRVPQEAPPNVVADLRARFAREATILASLDHPALPKVSDYFESEQSVCLVMDFVPGRDLHAVVVDARSRSRSLDEVQVVNWAEDVCIALTYLHAQVPPIVHRDVKPSNIKLTPDGQVRLVDFGLAQLLEGQDDSGVTMTQGVGSRPYQPLEQYRGDGVLDVRADVYALGATVYHLLTGRAPTPAGVRFVEPDSHTPLSDVRPDVSPRVVRAVSAALKLHPDDRPATAEALRQMLTASADLPLDGQPDDRHDNIWLAAMIVVLLAVAVAITFWP